MTPQAFITVVQGNEGYMLSFSLTDSSGAVVNLTGATVTFHAQLASNPAVQFSESMSVISAASGLCQYTVQATDFEVAGTYNCQIAVYYSSITELITFTGITVQVESSIPVSS